MGPAGRAAAGAPGRSRRGLLRHVLRHFRAVYADVVAGGPPPGPATRRSPTATTRCSSATRSPESAREGRWVEGRPTGRRAAPPVAKEGSVLMKLGFLTAPFPDTPLMDVADWAAASASRSSRSPAGPGDRPDPPLRRDEPHRRGEPVRRPGEGHPRPRSRARAWPSRAWASTRTRSIPTRSTARRSSAT